MRNRSLKWSSGTYTVLPTRGQVRVTQRHWLQELWRRHRRLYNAPGTFFSATHKTRISLKSQLSLGSHCPTHTENTSQPSCRPPCGPPRPYSPLPALLLASRGHSRNERCKNRAAHTAHATTLRMNRVRGGITLRHGSRMCGAPLGNACSSSRQDTRREGLRTSRDVTRGWPQLGNSAAT